MRRLPLLAALVAALAGGGIARSGATYVAGSTSPANAFAAAADFNTVAVSLADPGTPLRGTVTLSATASSNQGIASVRFQWAPAGTTTWTDACAAVASAPYTCGFATTGVADGSIDVRALATDTAGYTRTSTVSARRVDNTAPAVTLTDPGSPLSGSVSLSGSATDAGAGVSSVKLQYAPAGTSAWTDICAAASCTWSTASLADGLYDLRILATDAAGNQATLVRSARRVDNVAPAVSLADPGSYLRATMSLSATASDGGGIASVVFQTHAESDPNPSNWSTACTDTTAPYTCSEDTTLSPDGLYDLRAIATDNAGRTTTSTVLTARRIDNTAPTGTNVAGANGGTAGKLDAGDKITFTTSEQLAPASVIAGWSGASKAISVVVTDSGASDLITLSGVSLIASGQSLQTHANWVTGTVTFPATIAQSGTQIVVTLGSLSSSSLRTGVATSTQMTWPTATAATDLAGNPLTSATVTQSAAKVNF
jgi:Big-like domain-containing protein